MGSEGGLSPVVWPRSPETTRTTGKPRSGSPAPRPLPPCGEDEGKSSGGLSQGAGLMKAWSRRPPAPAALPLPGTAERERYAAQGMTGNPVREPVFAEPRGLLVPSRTRHDPCLGQRSHSSRATLLPNTCGRGQAGQRGGSHVVEIQSQVTGRFPRAPLNWAR
jgi:hypothetical protein